MGRPRKHDECTRAALLDAAETLVQRDGPAALSVRRVADEVGTTTRAVYSLFGSKDGLVDALGAVAFHRLANALVSLPPSGDSRADLVAAGAIAFRGTVIEHPVLFRLGVQQPKTTSGPPLTRQAAGTALQRLRVLITRLDEAGLVRRRTISQATWEFHAMCEGLAQLELRGGVPTARPEAVWRDALTTLVDGFASPEP